MDEVLVCLKNKEEVQKDFKSHFSLFEWDKFSKHGIQPFFLDVFKLKLFVFLPFIYFYVPFVVW